MKKVNRSAAHNALKAAALKWFKARGIFAWPNELKATYDVTKKIWRKHPGASWGVSDILGMTNDGRIIACEIKTGTGRLEPQQVEFMAAVEARNGLAIICRSIEDLEGLWRDGVFNAR